MGWGFRESSEETTTMLKPSSAAAIARGVSRNGRIRKFPDKVFQLRKARRADHITKIVGDGANCQSLSVRRHFDNNDIPSRSVLRPCIQRPKQGYSRSDAHG